MAAGFFIFIIALLFHRELFLASLLLTLRAQPRSTETYAIEQRARGLRLPRLFVFDSFGADILSLGHLSRGSCFVRRELWDQLDSKEREALLTWSTLTNQRFHPFRRLIGFFPILTIDRACLLMAVQPIVLSSLLRKIFEFRKNYDTDSHLSGLGLLGPSWVTNWPPFDARIKDINAQAARLQSS